MMEISHLKLSDIAKLVGVSLPLVSRHFKDYGDESVNRINNRIAGISPEAVEKYFKESGLGFLYNPSIVLSANICGGVGKTTSILNLGAACRRVTDRNTPIIYVDGDPQASLTSIVFGKPAGNEEPILIDFLEGKAPIEEILTDLGNNIWFIKSNLNQAWVDKVLNKPQDVKKGMLRFYQTIFEKLGPQAKIFQDHNPQLSCLFASSVCALNQLEGDMVRAIIVPIRSDDFAVQGAAHILKEIDDLTDTFSLQDKVDIHCFFSNVDKRITTTGSALTAAKNNEDILKHLSTVAIKFSIEIPRCILNKTNVYSVSKKNNHAAEDYQDLLFSIFNYKASGAS